MLVKLNYFKPNGKWYAEGEYVSLIPSIDLSHLSADDGSRRKHRGALATRPCMAA